MTMLVATLDCCSCRRFPRDRSPLAASFHNRYCGRTLIAALLMSIFLLPTPYVWIARDGDVLPAAEGSFEEDQVKRRAH